MKTKFFINKKELLAIVLFISMILALNYKVAQHMQNKSMQQTPGAILGINSNVA